MGFAAVFYSVFALVFGSGLLIRERQIGQHKRRRGNRTGLEPSDPTPSKPAMLVSRMSVPDASRSGACRRGCRSEHDSGQALAYTNN